MYKSVIVLFLGLLVSLSVQAKLVKYELEVSNHSVEFAGTAVDFALAVGLKGSSPSIPAPTLRFVEGDFAEITVTNNTRESTSIHWHGLLLPWEMDGVPGVTTAPIEPGTSFTFKFPIRQNGTYWYHSHTGLQEQRGVYGAIVIEPKKPTIQVDEDVVLVLSDWVNTNPNEILRMLKGDVAINPWRKRANGIPIPSWADAICRDSAADYLGLQGMAMDAMDVGDIAYDAFLINGKEQARILPNIKPGDRVRLRIINSAASSYFYVNLGQQMFDVISADGKDVQPVSVHELLIGMAETYDILFTVPEYKVYEFRATPQDVQGFASIFLGDSTVGEYAPIHPIPNPYRMDMSGMDHGGGHGDHGGGGSEECPPGQSWDSGMKMCMPDAGGGHGDGHEGHNMMATGMDDDFEDGFGEGDSESGGVSAPGMSAKKDPPWLKKMVGIFGHSCGVPPKMPMKPKMRKRLKLSMLKSVDLTDFNDPKHPKYKKDREVTTFRIELNGDMERYVWWLNGKTLDEDTYIDIKEGNIIRFELVNKTMMHHPMHLHGHFFRVIMADGKMGGKFSPLKHTIDVPPMMMKMDGMENMPEMPTTIEFLADEPGQWFFHCHNLYHMKAGMAKIVRYIDFDRPADEARDKALEEVVSTSSNLFASGRVGVRSDASEFDIKVTNGRVDVEFRGEIPNYDLDEIEAQAIAKYWFNRRLNVWGGVDYEDQETTGIAGMSYMAPYGFEMVPYTQTDGNVGFRVINRQQLTDRIGVEAEAGYSRLDKFEGSIGASVRVGERWYLTVQGTAEDNFEEKRIGAGIEYRFNSLNPFSRK